MVGSLGFLGFGVKGGGPGPTPFDAMPSLRDLLLILQAGRLVMAAQPIRRGQALPKVLDTMCGIRGLPSSVGEAEGHRAVERAASRLGRFGLADTCLIRSLALATLLADRHSVQLHLGFRPTSSPEALLAGHAWVTLEGSAVPDDGAILIDGRPCDEMAVLAAVRPGARQDFLETP